MRWRHLTWNCSCHHTFRADKLLLDNFFFQHQYCWSQTTKASQPGHRKRLWNNSRKHVFAWVKVTFKGNWLCLLGPIHTAGKFLFLHRMLVPWINTIHIQLLPPPLESGSCHCNPCLCHLQKLFSTLQDENCGWFIMSRFFRSEVNTESISHCSSGLY